MIGVGRWNFVRLGHMVQRARKTEMIAWPFGHEGWGGALLWLFGIMVGLIL